MVRQSSSPAWQLTAILTCGFLAVAAADSRKLPLRTQNLIDLVRHNPSLVIQAMKESPLAAVAPRLEASPANSAVSQATLPSVAAHGMGDSCHAEGMESIVSSIAETTGTYAVCIPIGSSDMDMINGFLMSLRQSVDIFAATVRADPKLAGGFNAIGLSQGTSIIRGYIERYNDPPVNAFISVHGTVMGVAAFPSCFNQGEPVGLVCRILSEVLGYVVYYSMVQDTVFQADYFRDPTKSSSTGYLHNSEMAAMNNEDPDNVNATYALNFAKTRKFAMVKAAKDSMVFPNEGQWWGSLADGAYGRVLPMKETKFYKQDLFGLRTAAEAGKIAFEETSGDHLQFTYKELSSWVTKYFMDDAEPRIQTKFV